MSGSVVVLRDLPGVAEIEEALHVPGRQLLKEYDDLEERIDALSRRLFGITEEDTQFCPRPDETVVDPFGVRQITDAGAVRWDEWDEHFAFLTDEYEEEGAFWAAAGWDVSDGKGEELMVMEYFGRQIVCLLKGLHPRARLSLTGDDPIPGATGQIAEREAEEWGRKLAQDAKTFKPRR